MKIPGPATTHRVESGAFLSAVVVTLFFSIISGCGSNMSQPLSVPIPGANTMVAVLATTTTNDQLTTFDLGLANIALTDSSGNSVTLFNNPNASNVLSQIEFMHLNGFSEPLVTVSVPQGVYTSAAVQLAGCSFTNITPNSSGSLTTATYDEGLCDQGAGNGTVNLPTPITIGGPAMTLTLNLQVSQSYTLNIASNPATYTISPVFTLTVLPISSNSTRASNGKITGLAGLITSVDAGDISFIIQLADGASLPINVSGSTAFQGVSGFSSLTSGMLVNMDVAIQPDGSFLVTRVESDDPASAEVTVGPVFDGPYTTPPPGAQFHDIFDLWGTLTQGSLGVLQNGAFRYQFSSDTTFSISGEFNNLQSLPFTPTFNGAVMFPGQNDSVYYSSFSGYAPSTAATAVTLMPQTINGTVTAISNSNGFAVYTVQLAPYDLIPVLQANPNPITPFPVLNNPSSVVVYADTHAQMLTSGTISVGSVFRFRGLIFFDSGTASMDASEILDGVPE